MNKIVYNYCSTTKEYLDQSKADICPVTKIDILVPANSTLLPPLPQKEGFKPCFNGEKWEYAADHRGKKYINENGEVKILDTLGNIPTDCLEMPNFEFWKIVKSDGSWSVVEDTDAIKKRQVSELHSRMESEVLERMKVVFDTTSSDSAMANKQTYDLMVSKPQLFVGKFGLTNEQEVISFAQAKLTNIETYAIWRMERIMQFKQDCENLNK